MSKLLLFTFLFSFAPPLRAQNTEKDSLKTLLATTKEDAKRVTILENLSYAYLTAYPDSALQFAQQGLQLAQSSHDPKGEAYCLNALGSVYTYTSDFSKALEMYFKSLEINEHLNNQSGIAVTYANIATVFSEQGSHRQALHYLLKTRQVDRERKDSLGVLIDELNLGNVYERLNQLDSALFYEQHAYQLAQRLHDTNFIPAILNSFGSIYSSLQQFPSAKDYYHQAIKAAQNINDQQVLSDSYYGLAKVARQTGSLDSAVFYARKAFLSAKEVSFRKQMLNASKILTNLFEDTQRFDSAFHYQRLSGQINDSLFSAEKVKQVQNLIFLEQQRQQSLQAARTEYQNQVKLSVLVSVLGALSIIGMLLWRNNRQKQRANTLLQQQNNEIQEQKNKVEQALTDLKFTQGQLIQQEKMASLGQLTAGVAHEINNPINFVSAGIDSLQANYADLINLAQQYFALDPTADNASALWLLQRRKQQAEVDDLIQESEQLFKSIKNGANRTKNIVKSLQNFTHLDENSLKQADVHEGLDSTLVMLQSQLNGIEIRKEYGQLSRISCYPGQLNQVFLNLLTNAIQVIDGKGQIAICTRQQGEEVVISIRDTGRGIPVELTKRIFEPFFTTKAIGKGAGLGLSVSYGIVEQHQGRLEVESELGKGATFIITLPVDGKFASSPLAQASQ